MEMQELYELGLKKMAESNYGEAADYLKKAVSMGHVGAMEALAEMHEKKQFEGADFRSALGLYLRLADMHKIPRVLIKLGIIFCEGGLGQERDPVEGVKLIEEGLKNLQDGDLNPAIYYKLGQLFYYGKTTESGNRDGEWGRYEIQRAKSLLEKAIYNGMNDKQVIDLLEDVKEHLHSQITMESTSAESTPDKLENDRKERTTAKTKGFFSTSTIIVIAVSVVAGLVLIAGIVFVISSSGVQPTVADLAPVSESPSILESTDTPTPEPTPVPTPVETPIPTEPLEEPVNDPTAEPLDKPVNDLTIEEIMGRNGVYIKRDDRFYKIENNDERYWPDSDISVLYAGLSTGFSEPENIFITSSSPSRFLSIRPDDQLIYVGNAPSLYMMSPQDHAVPFVYNESDYTNNPDLQDYFYLMNDEESELPKEYILVGEKDQKFELNGVEGENTVIADSALYLLDKVDFQVESELEGYYVFDFQNMYEFNLFVKDDDMNGIFKILPRIEATPEPTPGHEDDLLPSEDDPTTGTELVFTKSIKPYDRKGSVTPDLDTVSMGGETFHDAIKFSRSNASLSYNLQSKYTTLTGSIGRVDGFGSSGCSIFFYKIEGTQTILIAWYKMEPHDLPKEISINVEDVERLQIKVSGNRTTPYTFANITIE